MKIAFIVGTFPNLSESFVINQAAGLIQRGHQVDIFADCRGDRQKVHPWVAQYNLLERTYYLPAVPASLWRRVWVALGLLARYVFLDSVGVMRSLNVIKYGQQSLSLWMLLTLVPNLTQDYDIVHCQFGTHSYRGQCFRNLNTPNAKLVTTFRGDDISRFIQEKGPHIYDFLFQTGDFFLTNCNFFEAKALRLGCPADKLTVHRSGLDCAKFLFQPRYFPADGAVQIATTGRLVEKKGLEYGIRAVAQLVNHYPRLHYSILGDGPLRLALQNLIQQLGLAQHVTLLGWRHEQEIIAHLQQVHLFIAPSVTAKDGNQDAPINVLKEAMAMGIPVISTLHGGIPELVEEGVSGFLVPEGDADALAQKLQYLLAHPEQWPQMGKAGRVAVETHYDLNDLNDSLVDIYQQLLSTNPQPTCTLNSQELSRLGG
jgi:colanic acid/amylovoran biosynthesis glycosyltransferase